MNRRDFLQHSSKIVLAEGIILSIPKYAWAVLQGGPDKSVENFHPGFDPEILELRKSVPESDAVILQGELLHEKNSEYPFHLKNFNKRFFDVEPLAYFLPKTEQAISTAIQWAQSHSKAIHIRGGGHSYEGFSTGKGLLIDLQLMKQISVANGNIICGAGVRLGDLNKFLSKHGLAIPVGSCSSVGVSGLSMGGGHGFLTRKYGMTCDQIVSLNMIDADGQILDVSQTSNSDLLWAAQGGGGGSFGIVSEFELRAHPLANVIQFGISWGPQHTARALDEWQHWAPFASENISGFFGIDANRGNITKARCAGFFVGSENEFEKVIAPMRSFAACKSRSQVRPYLDACTSVSGPPDVDPVLFKAKSHFANELLSKEHIDLLIEQLRNTSEGAIAVLFDAYGGAVKNRTIADSAFVHREALFCVQYYSQWGKSSQTQSIINMQRRIHQAMQPAYSNGAYVNYADLDLVNYAEAYWGENLPRLSKIKSAVDPKNIFKHAQSVPLENPII